MATSSRSNFSHVAEAIGVFAILAVGAGVVITLIAVWVNASSLSNLRDSFYSYRSGDHETWREQALQSEVDQLVAAHNKDHPDTKIGTMTGTPGSITFYAQ